jgi:hypothetical protein
MLAQLITVIFATHKDITAEFMGRCFDRWAYGTDFVLGGFANPLKVCALQVADIVAYEFCRATRSKRPAAQRYPLKRLKEAQSRFLVFAETLAVAPI